jgi:cysteine desulfurase/selenocysteine lyase
MDFDRYRKEFTITQTHVFLNHAANAPESNSVIAKINQYLNDARYGNAKEHQWIQYVDQLRGTVAQFIGADFSEIAFTANVSQGAALVANGLIWQENDNIIVPDNQFPANIYPWKNLLKKGVQVRRPVLSRNENYLAELERCVDRRTKLLALSLVEYDDGFRYDLEKISAFCSSQNVLLFLDAVQALGALKVDVGNNNVDFMATSGHKWLMGPLGQGFLYIKQKHIENLNNVFSGWLSVVEPWQFHNHNQAEHKSAKRFEGGSYNLAGIAGLGAALEMILNVGIEEIESRVLGLSQYLIDRLIERDYIVCSNLNKTNRSGITAFKHPRLECDLVYEALKKSSVIVSKRNGRIRVSPHFYNNEDDIDRLISALPM